MGWMTPLRSRNFIPNTISRCCRAAPGPSAVVLDYLETLPQVDMKHVGMFGYSRDGKMATIASAMDERIAAVIAGSTGVGGVLPWRLSGERNSGEGIETTTRQFPDVVCAATAFFLRTRRSAADRWQSAGGDDRAALGADRIRVKRRGVQLMGQRAGLPFRAAKPTSCWASRSGSGILRVPGFHGANDQEACLDWLDIQFGRSTRTWTNNLLFPWDFDKWRANSKETRGFEPLSARKRSRRRSALTSTAAWEKKAAEIRKSVQWMLGDEPPMMPPGAGRGWARRPGPERGARGAGGAANPGQVTPDLVNWVIQRGGNQFGWLEPQKSQTRSRSVNFRLQRAGRSLLSGRHSGKRETARGDLAAWLQLSARLHVGLSQRSASDSGAGSGRLCGAGFRSERLRQPHERSRALLRSLSALVADGPHGGRCARRHRRSGEGAAWSIRRRSICSAIPSAERSASTRPRWIRA